jgi:hypothetical protein
LGNDGGIEMIGRGLSSLAIATVVAMGAAQAGAVTISFQNGVGGYTDADNRSFTYDGLVGSDTIRVDLPNASQPAGSYAWIFFGDIFGAGAVPEGVTITGATLEGWVDNPFGSATVARLLGDIANRPADFGASAGTFYEDDPAEASSASHAACATTSSCTPPIPIVWDVTAIVQAWANGDTNFGFVLVPETTDGGTLVGTDSTLNPTLRPILTVTYAEVPEPGVLVLLAAAALTLRGSRRAA